jgi:SOS-response transcriptional repressor LexA
MEARKEKKELEKRGMVEAGFPTSAEEELVDTITLDEYLLGNKEATYLLNVKSDSMRDAGILQGDTLVVERGKDAKKNDIVIVLSDGAYSMKYFSEVEKGEIVEAVVTAVVRKYK